MRSETRENCGSGRKLSESRIFNTENARGLLAQKEKIKIENLKEKVNSSSLSKDNSIECALKCHTNGISYFYVG